MTNTIPAPADFSPPAPCPEDVQRIHPAFLSGDGIWTSTDAPTVHELEFFRALPGADAFRRAWGERITK